MRIVRITFLLLLICATVLGQNISLESIRSQYSKVSRDSVICFQLYQKLSKIKEPDNIVSAYKGAIIATKANFVKNKQEKFKLFNEGKKILEEALAKDTNNIELRFIRFTIQTSSPKVLGYNKKIQHDKKYILIHLQLLKNELLRSTIREFLMQSAYLTEDEKQKIKI